MNGFKGCFDLFASQNICFILMFFSLFSFLLILEKEKYVFFFLDRRGPGTLLGTVLLL